MGPALLTLAAIAATGALAAFQLPCSTAADDAEDAPYAHRQPAGAIAPRTKRLP
ncbi:hypothetical protein [Streptomyces tubercidicus]|uniref:hypothetical protein n=1 Tax=Streptomyces tubercidicus TaxID=47759 RepID=UPI0036751F4F